MKNEALGSELLIKQREHSPLRPICGVDKLVVVFSQALCWHNEIDPVNTLNRYPESIPNAANPRVLSALSNRGSCRRCR